MFSFIITGPRVDLIIAKEYLKQLHDCKYTIDKKEIRGDIELLQDIIWCIAEFTPAWRNLTCKIYDYNNYPLCTVYTKEKHFNNFTSETFIESNESNSPDLDNPYDLEDPTIFTDYDDDESYYARNPGYCATPYSNYMFSSDEESGAYNNE